MELDFDKIKRIRKIRSVKSDLSKEENILIKTDTIRQEAYSPNL